MGRAVGLVEQDGRAETEAAAGLVAWETATRAAFDELFTCVCPWKDPNEFSGERLRSGPSSVSSPPPQPITDMIEDAADSYAL